MKWLIGRASRITAAGVLLASVHVFATEPEAVPGEYVVKLKAQVSVKDVNIKNLGEALGAYVKSTIAAGNVVVVKRPVVETRISALKSLALNELVEVAEPNYIYRINRTPNDPMLGQLWGLKNTGDADSSGSPGIKGIDIGAEEAWDIQTGSKDVIIAVIDTGTSYDNQDLKDNMWTNAAELNGQAGVDDDGNGVVDDIYGASFIDGVASGNNKDDHGHGSHCSGTIAGRGNDGTGIVGVNWNARIMGVKFLTAGGSGSLEDAILAINYATKMGAKIMSNSWGGGGFAQTLKEAIERSNAAGALFVAAAGNDSSNNDSTPSYPSTYEVPNIVSVAAINNKGQLASFSNYGRTKVHVGAPGVNVMSSTLDGKYESMSGTSMATPHVSGIAGLLVAQFPNMTNLEIKERIITTARPIVGLRGKVVSGGLANAYLALTNTLPQPDPNDPAKWATVAANVATAHPYLDDAKQEFQVKVDGAKQIAIYFSKFDTEASYDSLTIYDSKNNIVQVLTGNNDEGFSAAIDGDSARLVFTSDSSVNYYGFDISKLAWR